MFTPLHVGKVSTLVYSGMLISGSLLVTGCASNEKHDELQLTTANINSPKEPNKQVKGSNPWIRSSYDPSDPLEGFNRPMYQINLALDHYLIGPVATGYKYIAPDFVETGVTNFFSNLKGINVVLNDTLQGKFDQGASDTGRFLTNTTIGVLGLFDVATELGLESHHEDFGQTMATWGIGGPYLVLPILGPTTIRDLVGSATIDLAANPGSYIPGASVLEGISTRANADGALNFIDEAALDPYVFTRESFLQYRRNLINDGKGDANSYELDLDEALDDSAAPKEPSKTKKPDANSSSKLDGAAVAPLSSAKSTVSVDTSAFDRMSESFEQASIKMDQLSKKKVRFKYR